MSETQVQRGRGLGSLREVCDHYRIRQRANARLGSGIKQIAVQMMMSKIDDSQLAAEGLARTR